MNRNIYDWLDEYEKYHKNPINKIIHWFCVPMIMLSLFGLLSLHEIKFHIFNLDLNIKLNLFFIIIAIIFYTRLSLTITFGMLAISSIMLLIIDYILIYDTKTLFYFYLSIFIFSWIIQFIGHKIEGKKPAFIKDLKFLLIGPAWLLSFIYKKFRIKI